MNITEGITDYIKTELAPATSPEIALDTGLIGEGLLDSTAMLQLVLWVFLMFKAFQGEAYRLPVVGDIAAQRAGSG